jgi:hypothetical protein
MDIWLAPIKKWINVWKTQNAGIYNRGFTVMVLYVYICDKFGGDITTTTI